MLEQIISGGQTGADQAAWQVAQAFGLPVSGWMPKGFLNEHGPRPEFAESDGAKEMPTDSVSDQIERNVDKSDGTLWFGSTTSAAAQTTVKACLKEFKPVIPIDPDTKFEPIHVVNWIRGNKIRTLHVTGNQESDEPGIADRVNRFLSEVLRQLERTTRE
jgi:hypothetical protein